MEAAARNVAAMTPTVTYTTAELAVRKNMQKLLDAREAGDDWDKTVDRIFGKRRPAGLSPRNVYRLLLKVARENGVLIRRKPIKKH